VLLAACPFAWADVPGLPARLLPNGAVCRILNGTVSAEK